MHHIHQVTLKLKCYLLRGIIIPADIKKPEKIKNIKLNFEEGELLVILCSKNTHKIPNISDMRRYSKYMGLNFCFEQACLKSEGIHPNNKAYKCKFRLKWVIKK